MKLDELIQKTNWKHLCGSLDKTIDGAYAGDLLSWVMSNAQSGNLWVSIMSNVNVVAVASLCDVSCVVLAEGVQPDEGVLQVAEAKGVTILQCPLSIYGVCCRLHELGI